MGKLMCIGRVTADLELQESVRKEPYVRFTLAENLGYGEGAHTQFIQVWAWGYPAQLLVRRKVRKGSLVWVSGSLELEEYTRKDGVARDKRLKLKLDDWGFIPVARIRTEGISQPSAPPDLVGVVDGDREALPE